MSVALKKKIPLFLSTLTPLSYYGHKNKWISGHKCPECTPPMKPSKLWDNSVFPVKVLPDLPLSPGLVTVWFHATWSWFARLQRELLHMHGKRDHIVPPSHSRVWRPAGSPPKGSLRESKLKWLLPDNGGPAWWKKGASGYARAFFYTGISWPRESELFL